MCATTAEPKYVDAITKIVIIIATTNTNNNTGTVTSLGTLDVNGGTLINGLTVSLQKPGDWAKVTFNIENAGTIDAKLTSFSKHMKLSTASGAGSTTDTNEGITYTINCANGSNTKVTPVAEASVQELAKKTNNANGVVACELYVVYNELTGANGQSSQTAGQNQTVNNDAKSITLDASWVYGQK